MSDKNEEVEAIPQGGEVEAIPNPYWKTEKPTVFHIGGRDIDLIMVGPPQKLQLARILEFLEQDVKAILGQMPEGKREALFGGELTSIIELLPLVGQVLTPEIWQRLGEIVLAESPEFVETYFDIGWIIDGAETLYKYNYGVQRLAQAFFSK